MKKGKWYSTENVLIDLNRYWKIEIDQSQDEWRIVGLPEYESDRWEEIFKGEPEKVRIEWEDIEQILLS